LDCGGKEVFGGKEARCRPEYQPHPPPQPATISYLLAKQLQVSIEAGQVLVWRSQVLQSRRR
jgi:hypothetical protein